ncbi:MAG: hypothetical protein PHW24_04555 [Candidatus Moranbacteria bacterium]|nr:hypothetical protein [Candidatus Moranbacteria bacterium]
MEELKKKPYAIVAIVVVLIGGIYLWHRQAAKKAAIAKTKTTQGAPKTTKSKKENAATSQAAPSATPGVAAPSTTTPQTANSVGATSPSKSVN